MHVGCCSIALGQAVDLHDVRKVDGGLGASLEKLQAAHVAWQLAGKPDYPLYIDGAPIEDVCLTFVLPGVWVACGWPVGGLLILGGTESCWDVGSVWSW